MSLRARLLVAHALAATAMAMPWPALLAAVWESTGSETALGLAGAARMLPYVVLSALAGALADRLPRARVLRWSTGLRMVALLGCALAYAGGQLGPAVGCAVLAVALGTPAYPAAVALMPAVGGAGRVTGLLVTAEVTAFVVGPALGGVLLGLGLGPWSVIGAAVAGAVAVPLLAGLPSPLVSIAPSAPSGADEVAVGRWRLVLGSPGVALAIAVVAVVNFVESAASVGLIGLSHQVWGTGDQGYGVATAALGFGSLGAPLLGLVLARRGALAATGGGLLGAGLMAGPMLAAAPLALAGAAGTVVECAATDTLQGAVPDHVRAFSLGLTDSVMVAAAMLGSLVAPWLNAAVGPVGGFLVLGLVVAAVSVPRSRTRDLTLVG